MSILGLFIAAAMTPQPAAAGGSGHGGEGEFAHMVFFSLAEPSDENSTRLIEACRQYLSGHEGTLHFSVGTRAAEMQRSVNMQDFDVALHVVFESRAAHDLYQAHPRHLEFVEKNSTLWKDVRVFDSYVD